MPLSKATLSYIYSILKPHSQSSRSPIRLLLSKAKPSYAYLVLKPHGQSSKSPVRLLQHEAKPNYIYTTLKKHHFPNVSPRQLCVSAHLGCTQKWVLSSYKYFIKYELYSNTFKEHGFTIVSDNSPSI